jgi:multicomponent Na+:H+ antiporter subunit D
MTLNQLPVIIPVSLLLFTFITFLFGIWRKGLAFPVALTGVAISWLASIFGLITVLQSGPIYYYLGGWPPPIGIEYVLDNLSAFMAVILLSIAFLGMIYSRLSFQKEVPEKIVPLYALILLLLAVMIKPQ